MSETLHSRPTTNSTKADGSWKRFSPNIGVRRQHRNDHTLRYQSGLDWAQVDDAQPLSQRISNLSYGNGTRRFPERFGRQPRPAIQGQAFPPEIGSKIRFEHVDSGSTTPEYPSALVPCTHGWRKDSSSSASSSTSTIPTNPDLDLLPVVKTDQARASFDFYVNSYVTSIMEVSQGNNNYSQLIHQILHDELLFTAFTTCSEAARWRTQSLYGDAPVHVAKGYGKTISLLTTRLRSEKFTMSPTVLLTMGQLTAIETMIKNVSATAKHLVGMQSAMMVKTGTKPSMASSPVQTAIEIWTQYFMYRAAAKSRVNRNASLTYPRHPFGLQLGAQISMLPIGFSDIVLSGRISIEMLDLISNFDVYFTTMSNMIKDGINDSPERTQIVLQQAAYCIEYAQIRSLTLTERLLLAALTAYVVRRDRIHPALINIRGYFQITCAYLTNLLSSVGTILGPNDRGSGIFTWIGLTLLLTSTPEAAARKLALKLLPRRPEPMKNLKICQEFYWDDELTNALLSGSVLPISTSNDVIAENMDRALPKSQD